MNDNEAPKAMTREDTSENRIVLLRKFSEILHDSFRASSSNSPDRFMQAQTALTDFFTQYANQRVLEELRDIAASSQTLKRVEDGFTLKRPEFLEYIPIGVVVSHMAAIQATINSNGENKNER